MIFDIKKLPFWVGTYASILVVSTSVVADKKTYEMDRVIVSAKAPVDAAKFAGSVSVVTSEEIRASGATSVTEVLESTPGIQLVVTGSNSTQAPQIRGQSTEQVLVLVNGKRLPNTDRNIPFAPALRYNWVPVANIDRIEIIRGPASSLYGADALAGVINIITREANEKWSGSVSLYGKQTDSANGGDGEGISLAAAGPLTDSIDLGVAVESRSRDAIFDKDKIATIQSQNKTNNLQADLGFDINETDRLKLGVLYGTEKGEDIDNGFFGIGTIPLDVKRRLASIDYTTRLGTFDTSIGIVASNSDVEEGTAIWKIKENNVSIDLQGELNKQHYLSYGIQYREEDVDRNDTTVFNEKINATTLFVQDVINVTTASTLTLGLAYDVHSKYDNEASPKINWFTQLSPIVGIKMGYGESYLAPSLREGSSAYVVSAGPTRTYIGNDDLQPETAKTVEAGLTFNQKNSTGSITLFRTEVDNLITTISTVASGFPPVTTSEYNNVNEALLQGVETEWSFYNDSRSKKLNLSYTYLDAKNRSGEDKGNQLTDRAQHIAKINYFQKLPFAGLNLDTGVRYLGKQYTDTKNTKQIDAYAVGDIGLSKVLYKDLQLRFGIDNVTNKIMLDEAASELIEEGRSYRLTLSSTF
ncbi:MAG: outer membrane receptor for ferrienterochelin and colicins [Paraglaciecola sp.]|jgi:outer membrane receptor for ferrienterochelin and colicins